MALSTQRASPSLLPPLESAAHPWKYDVFLSFRGEDTRQDFTSHLYHELQHRQDLRVFKDDRELELGAKISPELFTAIEQSYLAIIILSPNYASSTWCLDELAKILECMESKDNGRVLPIFLKVNPCDVRHQKGTFAEAFLKHEQRHGVDKLNTWRAALSQVASLSGLNSNSKTYECERELIEAIVECVWSKVQPMILLPSSTDKLVGINSKLEELSSLLALEENDVRVIGICGMGGVGKTTLAELVYERFSHLFVLRKFIVNFNEVSSKHKKLLSPILKEDMARVWNEQDGKLIFRKCFSNKRVILILDNVDHDSQLESVIENKSCFGEGSRIIVTTRDERLLIQRDIDKFIRVEVLNRDEALELFSRHAFRKDLPQEDFMQLSEQFVDYAKGLPLALKDLGLSLYDKNQEVWSDVLDKLKKYPNPTVFKTLRLSYDGLDDMEKNTLLDIAFFYKGMERGHVSQKLRSCGISTCIGIDKLVEKSMLIIQKNESSVENVEMHDFIQEMALEIVRQESLEEPGLRSRLCHRDAIFHVFTNNTGTEKIKGIRLCLSEQEEADSRWNCESFSRMFGLTYLEFDNLIIKSVPQSLPDCLRTLKWSQYPSKSLPATYKPKLLTELQMRSNKLVRLWNGIVDLPQLKSIDLGSSKNLTKIPDVTGIPNLEQLQLTSCTNLLEIHPSVAVHKKLKILNLGGCRKMKNFLTKIEMDSLEQLNLSYCSKVKKIPEFSRGMTNLSILKFSQTDIAEIPPSIENLVELCELNMSGCKRLTFLSEGINGKLKSLRKLSVIGSSKLEKLPETLGGIENLEEVLIDATGIRELPYGVFQMKNLRVLRFVRSNHVDSGNWTLFARDIQEPFRFVLPSLRELTNLELLDISNHNLCEGDIPDDIGSCLSSLGTLTLSGNNFVTLPTSIKCLSKLSRIELARCKKLEQLPELPSNIRMVIVDNCASLKLLSGVQSKTSLFSALNCFQLVNNGGCWNNVIFPRILLPMLRGALTTQVYYRYDNGVVVPGSRIPDWFDIQSDVDSFTAELPLAWPSRESKCMGLAFCVLIADPNSPRPEHECPTFAIRCLEAHASFWGQHSIMGSHLWIFYRNRNIFTETRSPNLSLSFEVIQNKRCSKENSSIIVQRCGARWVYEQDLKLFFNRSMTRILDKRSRDQYDDKVEETGEEAGSSGSGNGTDTMIPPHRESLFKRLKVNSSLNNPE